MKLVVKRFVAICFLLFVSSTYMSAQVLNTVSDLTQNDFTLTNETEIYDQNGNIVAYEASYTCFWRYFRRKKCRRKGGICAKGRTKYDLEGNIISTDYIDPTDNSSVQNVVIVKTVDSNGEESILFNNQ